MENMITPVEAMMVTGNPILVYTVGEVGGMVQAGVIGEFFDSPTA